MPFRLNRRQIVSGMASLSKAELLYQRWLVAYVGCQVTHTLINPRVYASIGLDPEPTWQIAMHNPAYRESIRWAGERIMAFLSDAGLVAGPGMPWWRRSFLLGAS